MDALPGISSTQLYGGVQYYAGRFDDARLAINLAQTAVMPRDHHITRLPSGLIHITGGKWTTCRRMAEDAINAAVKAIPV